MARQVPERRRPRSTVIGATSVVVVVGLLTTLAVTAEGYDAQETPRLESSVWVTRDDGKYARVNTDLGEIDTVRAVEEPSNVIQSGAEAFVLTQGDRLLWPVDAANPLDLTAVTASDAPDDDAPMQSLTTPQGTRDIITGGTYVAYLTDTKKVFLGQVGGEPGAPNDPSVTVAVDPYAELYDEDEEDVPVYSADAVAVSPAGDLVLYSADEQAIRRYDATTRTFTGDPIAVPSGPDESERVELALIGTAWVLSAPSASTVWTEAAGAVETGLTAGALLQSSVAEGDVVYVADQNSIVSIDVESGGVTIEAEASGTPARPTMVGDVVYAAWIDSSSGTLWSSESDATQSLEVPEDELEDVQAIVPVIRSNGTRAVLSETSSGLLWTLPDGDLIPLEQWTIDDVELDVGTVQVDDVAEQEPPVAVADAFGVRSGQLIRLPLLLNDHDPNKKDVLTVDASSVAAGLSDPAFGSIGLISNNQEAVVRVRATSGTASFTYSVTDGVAVSTPVTVTLTIVPDDQNTAPVWCGVDGCRQEWPTPQVAPGGTITVPVLGGWVDPEGDPIVVTDARKDDIDDSVTVVPKADGSVAIRQYDANAAGGSVPITVSISDARGATAIRTLDLLVTASPALSAEPLALVVGAGEKATIVVSDHVVGGSGSYRLVDATSASSGLLVVPNTAAGRIELTADAVGDYSLTYTVQDASTLAEQSAIVRVSVVGGDTPLTMAPITTFVRAKEDTTVDVLGAVQNSTGRVLLVASAITGDPDLSVSVVGQSAVRVSGGTADGLPGRIGSALISVTDGDGVFVEGSLTVFLAPPSTGVGPIATPDTATVRAGGQVDIPVTANDVGPRGERLSVHPTVEFEEAAGELAFVSGDSVRYLAPTKEGTYTVRYSVYLGNEPSRVDTATITITVVAAGANRAPQPTILEAHVLSGQTVSIPVDSYGMDPDGDYVVLSSVSQPKGGQGVASISGDGKAIIYTAPGTGISGSQFGFKYTVRDALGETAEGAVRVGVLNADLADGAPVTYSDYVRAQKDAAEPVTVRPLLNDSDPADGELKIIKLVPNAPANETNPEYARLESLIDPETSLEDGTILLNAGDVLGTHSYVYTVESSITSSWTEGLIVVTVADEGAIDHPEVTDTIVTAKDRNQLETGIDVVSGKVQWPTGDVSKLKLALWGKAGRYTVSGNTIAGPLPKAGDVIPFSLTGDDATGAEIKTYGFLRIPAFDDMRLQLRSNFEPITVAEEKSVEFDILDVIDADSSETVQVRDEDDYIVQRANSSCVPSGSTDATYTAGREKPWTDYCAIPVRLAGQSKWTILAVPIIIQPKDPMAQLGAITRTVAPGTSTSIELYDDMTTWQGGRVGNKKILDYTIAYSPSSFIVTQTGTTVSIDARADAKPGTRETISVSVTSYGGLTAAITLVVGIAAPDAPRGATFTQQCDVRTGASCGITAIGLPGEYDPFAGKAGSGITLVSVGNGGSVTCAVATVTVASDTRIVATYPSGPKPAGGECIVPFTVKDAQGRTGMGQVTIDVLGYPARPASVTTSNYSGNSVTLAVALGEAVNAHPAVTGVTIWENGGSVPATCAPAGASAYECVVSGLVNGEVHNFTARAVNSIGDSLDTTSVSTSAYQVPNISITSVTPVYTPGVTSTSVATVSVKIAAADDQDVVSFRINNNQTEYRTGPETTVKVVVPPGSNTITVVPVSRYRPPTGGSSDGNATSAGVTAIGQPYFNPNSPSATPGSGTITLSGVSLALNSGTVSDITYIAWIYGTSEPSCQATAAGGLNVSGATYQSTNNPTVSGLELQEYYAMKACGTNNFGIAESNEAYAYVGSNPGAPTDIVGYTISKAPSVSGNVATYGLTGGPSGFVPPAKFETRFDGSGMSNTTAFSLNANNGSAVTAKYCRIGRSNCSTSSAVPYVNAPNIAIVTFPNPSGGCLTSVPTSADVKISAAASGSGSVGVAYDAVTMSVVYTVTWGGAYVLDPVSSAAVPVCLIVDPDGG